MGTKLRSFSYNTWVKTTAFLLAVISFGLGFSFLANMLVATKGANELMAENYLSTPVAESQIQSAFSAIDRIFTLKSEDYITNELGYAEYERQVADRIQKLNEAINYLTSMQGIYYYVFDGENTFTNCDMTTISEFKRYDLYNISDRHSSDSSMSFYVDKYIPSDYNTKVFIALEDYAASKADVMYNNLYTLVLSKSEDYIKNHHLKVLEEQIENNIREFSERKIFLQNLEGIYYYATDGEIVLTNCEMTTADEFKGFINHNIIDGYAKEFKIGNNPNASMSLAANKKVFIAYDDDFVARNQYEFEQTKATLQNGLVRILALFILSLLMLVYLAFVCGRDTNKDISKLIIDRLWTELTLGALVLVVGGFVSCAAPLFGSQRGIIYTEFQTIVAAVTAIVCAIWLMLLLSLVRHIKNRTLIKNSLIYIVCRRIGVILKNVCKTIFNITPLNIKIIGAILLAELLAVILSAMGIGVGDDAFLLFFFLMIAATVGIIYTMLRFVIKPYDDEVKTRLELSLNREMKAERLKTDLITNVSHDLKTPLTAIINYSDLLLKQDEENEYAKVIYDKSQKLKTLTEDLFEVSKAQSGNIATTIEQLNVSELINQTLAEFEDYTVDFKLNVQNASISADGKLMSRVFENLIGNIIKYSLPNTRAYIDSFEQNRKTYITFKNIANYEMGFDGSEMTERFSRGDTSRTTDGNGLGLAIAQSYTEASGGRLTIDTDGDLFKVTLVF